MSGKKTLLIIIIILVIIGIGVFSFVDLFKKPAPAPAPAPVETGLKPVRAVIGKSVEGREIAAFTYGDNAPTDKKILFMGGIHGGYEWNSVLLAYQVMDYLEANPAALPANITVSFIPSVNPDGVFKVVGKEGRFALADVSDNAAGLAAGLGRFNSHDVDINRNFDCKWQPTSTWRTKTVSAGTAAFSEPEAQAIRDFVLKDKPDAVVSWHSQANAAYASECEAGILPETLVVLDAYSKASGYAAVKSFDAYPVSGDSESWFAKVGIPAITVELKTHETVEWEKNIAGVKALLAHFAN